MSDAAVMPSEASKWKEVPQSDSVTRGSPVTLRDTAPKALSFPSGHNHDARLSALQQAV